MGHGQSQSVGGRVGAAARHRFGSTTHTLPIIYPCATSAGEQTIKPTTDVQTDLHTRTMHAQAACRMAACRPKAQLEEGLQTCREIQQSNNNNAHMISHCERVRVRTAPGHALIAVMNHSDAC